MSETDLIEISGVGAETARRLRAAGFDSVEDLARAEVDAVATVPGFGRVRAAAVRDAARAHVAAMRLEAAPEIPEVEDEVEGGGEPFPVEEAIQGADGGKKSKGDTKKSKSGKKSKKVDKKKTKKSKDEKKSGKKSKGDKKTKGSKKKSKKAKDEKKSGKKKKKK